MAYINVDEVFILDNTGLQVDMATDIPFADAGFTDAQKEQARKNIGAGGTNPNLLDNPFFTIDQTSETSGAATGGTAKDVRDRWRIARCSEYTFNDDGTVTTKWDGTGSGCYLIQYGLLDNAAFYKGKTCTLSFYADGVLYQKTITMPTGTNTSFTLGGVSVNVNDVTNTGRGYEFQFYHSVSAGKTLGPFKLEKGSVSTLPNDGPPDFEEELAKCQRVFIRINAPYYNNGFGIGRATGGTTCLVFIPLPVPLRASPTVSYSAAGNLQLIGNGSNCSVTALAYSGRSEVGVNLSVTTSGISVNQLYFLTKTSQDCYIDLSCRPS